MPRWLAKRMRDWHLKRVQRLRAAAEKQRKLFEQLMERADHHEHRAKHWDLVANRRGERLRCSVDPSRFRRLQQVQITRTERGCQLVQRHDRGISPALLEAADVLLAEAGAQGSPDPPTSVIHNKPLSRATALRDWMRDA